MKEGGSMQDVRFSMTHKLDTSKPSDKETKTTDLKEMPHGKSITSSLN
jgi:hypothetical protein